MTTDNRTTEPTEAQIEAAAQLMWKERALGTTTPEYPWRGLAEEGRERLRAHAREVLMAAARAAQGAAPVLPSSGVDEDKLAEVIELHVLGEPNGGTASWAWINCSCGHRIEIAGVTREYVVALGRKHQASAIAEWLKGQGR